MQIVNLEKLGEYKSGRMEWTSERLINIIYAMVFKSGVYVGSTKEAKGRFTMHLARLKQGKNGNEKLQAAFNECESFEVYCLERVNREEDIRQREQFYIDIISPDLNSQTAYSYNTKRLSNNGSFEIVKEKAKEKGLTMTDLASRLGITYRSLYKSLKKTPTLKRMQEIAKILKVNVTEILRAKAPALLCPHCGKSLSVKIE